MEERREKENGAQVVDTAPGDVQAIDIVAIILSVIVAPVGLVLGVVRLVRAKKHGAKAPILALLSAIIGGVFTGGGVIAAVVGLVVVGSVASTVSAASSTDSFCAVYSQHLTELQELASLSSDDPDFYPKQYDLAVTINSWMGELQAVEVEPVKSDVEELARVVGNISVMLPDTIGEDANGAAQTLITDVSASVCP